MRFLVMSIALLVGAQCCLAQMCDPPQQTPVVSFPSGTLISQIGTSDIPITSQSDKCKALVRQGFALVHCFWFNEAVRSFRDATKEDPSCGIAWCGLCLAETLPWNDRDEYADEVKYALTRALQGFESAGPLEKRMITAFRNRQASGKDRDVAFNKEMHQVIAEFPDVNEPRLVLAGITVQSCMTDRTLPNGELQYELTEAAKLIEPVLARDPRNPAALHYHIHAYEGSDPAKALPSARLLCQVASGSAHMVHMSGHIYNVLGLWNDANGVFERSAAIGEEYAKKVGTKASDADWNYGHNRHYRSVNYAEQGRLKDALAISDGTDAQCALLWRIGDWNALLAKTKGDLRDGETAFYCGMAAAQVGELELADKCLDRLLKSDSSFWGRIEKRVLETQKLELTGLILSMKHQDQLAVSKLRMAVESYSKIEYEEPPYYLRPPHETLAQALIRAKKYDEGIEVLLEAIKLKPNSGTLLFAIGQALEASGDIEAAKKQYKAFLSVWPKADSDLSQIVHAKSVLSKT